MSETPPTILVADRNRQFLETTSDLLHEAGIRMAAAQDGDELERLLRRYKPAAVLLDVKLPGGPGDLLCKRLKARDPTLPIVLLYGREDGGTKSAVLDAGADNYLLRPIKRRELLFAVRDMIRLNDLYRERESLRAALQASRATQKEQAAPAVVAPAPPPSRPKTAPQAAADRLDSPFIRRQLYLEIKRSKRYGFPLSALLIAIDAEEALRGRHGEVGIARLREAVARAVRLSLRDLDIPLAHAPGRILIVMPQTDKPGSRTVAERIRNRIRRSALRDSSGDIRCTISIGAATLEGSGVAIAQLLQRAQQALQAAAQLGGDRVISA